MFTGIIEEIGTVDAIRKGARSAVLVIRGNKIFSDLKIGDSVATNGVCLTATEITGKTFSADVMNETLSRSTLGKLRPGSPVNLERAMAADGRFGGHMVAGHVDGTGKILHIRRDDNAIWYKVRTTSGIMRYIIEKGSIAIDGISLTVAKTEPEAFSVSVIPHTAANTILTQKKVGDTVNLENDCVGKYVEKLLSGGRECGQQREGGQQKDGLTREFLAKNGF